MAALSGRCCFHRGRCSASGLYLLDGYPAHGETDYARRTGRHSLQRNHGARAGIGPKMIGSFHIEPALAIAYVLLLILIAAALERLAKHSPQRAGQYHTGGFRFHRARDAWECPAGIALIRAEIDY